MSAPLHSSRRAFVVSLTLSPIVGCHTPNQPKEAGTSSPSLPPYRGPLLEPASIPFDFLWQQRVTATHGERSGGFSAVVQKQGNQLLVLGLTPMKTRGFLLTQQALQIEYEQYVPFDLPFEPKSVLYDIHRAFFYGLLDGFPQQAIRASRFEDETIKDEFERGRLTRRTFDNVSSTGKRLLVEYQPDGYQLGQPPKTTLIDNRAYGYRLKVETLSTQAL